MVNLCLTTSLEYLQKAYNVAVNVCMRIDEGISDAGLGCQVHDSADWLFSKQGCHTFAVSQIHFDEPELRERRKLRKPRFFEAHIVILIEIVEAQHMIAALQQPSGHVVPDKAGRAGNKNRGLRLIHALAVFAWQNRECSGPLSDRHDISSIDFNSGGLFDEMD